MIFNQYNPFIAYITAIKYKEKIKENQTCLTTNVSPETPKGSVKIVRKPLRFPKTTSVNGRSPT